MTFFYLYQLTNLFKISKKTALHQAAAQGDITFVKKLLDEDYLCGAQDSQGNTPLPHAARNRHEEMLTVLLERRSSSNISNKKHNTPLYIAIYSHYACMMHPLLKGGADPDIKNQ